ncbi:type II toxin-antitoxin system HipA family toxin [Leeia sp. TBRC 13508]|uniref:Type II toxin-antitoxin system HipA family toxin n=1 Tax=Leeia speluncae TaxID=2884804 RepID=A0ABS8DAA4_9NEIS|nr:type II toxin-antitoxin system HipA family toxin [Leeia speluncae]MCB6185139.1 type II toxin-antitoxin system HipA family toxin [Leeia speluncae]
MNSAEVHVWLPGNVQPTLSGVFEQDNVQARFRYDAIYQQQSLPAISVDLPIKRAVTKLPGKEAIFPIFLDSGPDDWGHMLLERKHERPLNKLEALILGPADGAGNLVLGPLTDDRFDLITVDTFLQILQDLPQDDDPSVLRYRSRVANAVHAGTSLGGAKPKLTLIEGKTQYIVKFPERGDDIYLPHVEAAMLAMAKQCDILACDAHVREVSPNRYGLFVTRFDREYVHDGFARHGYLSAGSVINLDRYPERPEDSRLYATKGFTPRMYIKSYVNFADCMLRWTGSQTHLLTQLRELWRRIVFNALVRNTDDHPYNHGLRCHSMSPHQWTLAPAFDIVCQRTATTTPGLTMPFLFERGKAGKHSRLVSTACRRDLVVAAVNHYGYEANEAEAYIADTEALIRNKWRDSMLDQGMPADELEKYIRILDEPLPD